MKPEDVRVKWLQENTTVCICRGIPRKRFVTAIKTGSVTLQAVHQAVGSGSGECRGERCSPRILALLDEYIGTQKK